MEVFFLANNKLTKAQQAAEPKKRKKVTVEEDPPKKQEKKPALPKKSPSLMTKGDAAFPLRYAVAGFCAVLLLIYVSVLFSDEGLLLQWLVSLVSGLFGRNVYYISIPALCVLIWIQLASRGQRVRGRSFCMIFFVFIYGCLSHLTADYELTTTGFAQFAERYTSGLEGLSGGVICGLLTDVVAKGLGRFFLLTTLWILAVLCVVVSIRLDLVGLFKKVYTILMIRLEQRRQDRLLGKMEAEDDDEDEEDHPGLFTRLLDRIATMRVERQAHRSLEGTSPDDEDDDFSENLTGQLLRRYEMIEDDPDAQDHPAPFILTPVEPEVQADIAAAPGAAPAPIEKVTRRDAAIAAAQVEQEIEAGKQPAPKPGKPDAAPKPAYSFPPIELLKLPRGRSADGTNEMRENTRRLNESLASYKIDAHISNVTRGPSVTRYEVELERGVRLNKLTSCADDIALSLGASGVRIAPVPGKISVVGIEVPNQTVTTVSLRDVIDSPEFNKAASHSSIAVGKDIGGACIIGNIAKFPHMLIAGTTGSGKSVCMNSIIISLLYKASPEDVKLIMVDPKMVELGIYNGIPHLLIPVVTDPKKAAGSLQWAVTEMMRRYRSMSDAGVRDLESYNSMIIGGELEGEKLPQIVVIIDELADLMLVAAKEVEESICRIAQMGRAAGIHLIIATQRPSADVITGLMKANIPSRIAFSVASAMESRIILDTVGAEKLVGKGDMLYSPIGSGKPQRVQGCFVTDGEVEAVATYVKEHFASTYDQSVMDDIEQNAQNAGSKGSSASEPDPCADELAHDEMLPDAVEVILETKQASVSLLQRRLKLGYARAARIVDEMEEMGIVGPFAGAKPRQILITKEQWDQMKQGQTIVTQLPEPVPEEDIDIPF